MIHSVQGIVCPSQSLSVRILNQIAVVVHTRPLGLPIWNIDDPLRIEHVALRSELLPVFRALELDKCREQQDHISTLIHDRRAAVCAADLARQLVHSCLVLAIIPRQIVVAMGEVDICLVEDCCPLKRCAMDHLAGGAMAVLGCEWLLPAELELDLAAMAAALVLDIEVAAVIVNGIGWPCLPVVFACGMRVLDGGPVGRGCIAFNVLMLMLVIILGGV